MEKETDRFPLCLGILFVGVALKTLKKNKGNKYKF